MNLERKQEKKRCGHTSSQIHCCHDNSTLSKNTGSCKGKMNVKKSVSGQHEISHKNLGNSYNEPLDFILLKDLIFTT